MLTLLIWGIILVVVLGGAVALVVAGLNTARAGGVEEDPLMARLAEATQRGDVVSSLEQIEMQQPFSQRVLLPVLRGLGELSTRFTPQKVLEDTTKKLEMAGNPGRVDAATFLASRFIVAAVFGGLLLLIGLAAHNWPFAQTFLVTVAFTAIGFFFPQLWLQSRIGARQKDIRKAMPDALDLLTICVEAGLGFDAAMSKVAEKWENQLSVALLRAIREIQLGKPRRDALKDMSDRIGLAEMTSFVAAVIQSEILGVSLAKVLRIQSDQMRVKRRQRAEETAHQAPIKMIIPMALLTFPSIFIILLVPAGMQIQHSLIASSGK
jgi:tight adherence protein C